MVLTLEQIRNITVGALEVRKENDVMRFVRCTEKQIDAWYKVDRELGYRAESTSGVRLDFYTDSKKFIFEIEAKARYEVYIDGSLCYAFVQEDFENLEKEILLDGKKHRITLVFPNHFKGGLKKVELDDGALLEKCTYNHKILILGDSITQGWNSKYDSLSFAWCVTRFFEADSIIQGIGGATFNAETFDMEIDYDPDIVIIACGTNDWSYCSDFDDISKRCFDYLSCVAKRFKDKKLFFVTPIWRTDFNKKEPPYSFADCCALFEREAKKCSFTVINGEALTPKLPDFYTDGLHPNDLGFTIYGLNLASQIQKYI